MSFDALREELDRWERLGRRATLWWRDDDAAADTPALRRLLTLADTYAVTVSVAVVPMKLTDDAVRVIARCRRCAVMQHGYAHADHAPQGEKRSELGSHRALSVIADELSRGRERLSAAFGSQFAPVLVPPWNRIGAGVMTALPELGYRGVSTFAPRREAMPVAGLVQCNTHADVIAWRDARAFVGEDEAAARVAAHLASRRELRADADEPTGLLTHHLDLGTDAWTFVERLLAFTREHRAARWISPRRAFGLAEGSATSGRSA